MSEAVPDVTLVKTDGARVRLRELIGSKTLVLFFYPRDHSAGCTVEACSFRDQYEDFKAAGAEVIGISADDEASHESFRRDHRLPFVLLTDPDHAAARAFGIKRSLGLIEGRVTFVIDRQGLIRHRFESQVRVNKHVEEALAVVRSLEAVGGATASP